MHTGEYGRVNRDLALTEVATGWSSLDEHLLRVDAVLDRHALEVRLSKGRASEVPMSLTDMTGGDQQSVGRQRPDGGQGTGNASTPSEDPVWGGYQHDARSGDDISERDELAGDGDEVD